MVNPQQIARIQKRKAQIIAQEIFLLLDKDDTSSEILQMVEARTTDVEVVEQVLVLIESMQIAYDDITERMEDVDEDPGNEAAEQIVYEDIEDHYLDAGDDPGNG